MKVELILLTRSCVRLSLKVGELLFGGSRHYLVCGQQLECAWVGRVVYNIISHFESIRGVIRYLADWLSHNVLSWH